MVFPSCGFSENCMSPSNLTPVGSLRGEHELKKLKNMGQPGFEWVNVVLF